MLTFIGIILSILNTIWAGFVVSKLYGWFLIPLNFPILTLAHIIGIMTLFTIVFKNFNIFNQLSEMETHKEEYQVKTFKHSVYFSFYLLIGLFQGWIITLFM